MVRDSLDLDVASLDEAHHLSYGPHAPSYWTAVPRTIGDALDQSHHLLRDTTHAGVLEAITITDEGGLNISWAAGEVFTPAGIIQVTDASAGAQACTDNAVNYLVWTAGATLTLRTTPADPDTEIQVGHIQCQDGDIWHFQEEPIISDTVPAVQTGLGAVAAVLVESGMVVTEDADATNALDVAVSAGKYWLDCHDPHPVAQVDTRTGNILIRCYINGAGPETWDLTAGQHSIDIANWNNGVVLVGISANKYYKGLFVVSQDNVFWIYAQEQHNTIASAIEGDLPSIPAGFELFPRSIAYIYKGGEAAFQAAGTNRWIDVRPRIGTAVPGSLSGAFLENVVDDTSPQLGGNLDVNGNSIVSVANGDINITPDGTGDSYIGGVKFDDSDNVSTPGNVGIGTNSPAVNLQLGDVGGGHKQITIHADGDALTLKQDVAGDDTYQTWYTAGGVRRGYFGYAQGSSDVLTLGNETGGHIRILGIDEDDVGIEDGKFLLLLNDPDTTANKQKGIAFGRADNKIIAGIEPNIPVGGGGHLDFYTAALDNSPSLAMRIDKDGVLSIDNIQELTAAAGVTIDGVLIKNSNVSGMASLDMAINTQIKFVTNKASFIFTGVGNDNFQLGIACGGATQSGFFSLMELADITNANRSPLTTPVNPTFRVYSADEAEALDYIDVYHDQTDGVIDVGNGILRLESAVVIDETSTEALLIRQEADAADVFVVDTTNKKVGVGAIAALTQHLEIHGTGVSMSQTRYTGASATQGAGMLIRKARGTQAVPTVVVNGDKLSSLNFQGYSGAASAFRAAARIECYVDGIPDTAGDTTDMPGRIELQTSPNGSSVPATRLIVYNNGYMRLVNTNMHFEFFSANNYISAGTDVEFLVRGAANLNLVGVSSVYLTVGAAQRMICNATGVAFNGNAPIARPNYTTANVTPDRSFDADATTTAELADIVGTLIADLISYGLLQ